MTAAKLIEILKVFDPSTPVLLRTDPAYRPVRSVRPLPLAEVAGLEDYYDPDFAPPGSAIVTALILGTIADKAGG